MTSWEGGSVEFAEADGWQSSRIALSLILILIVAVAPCLWSVLPPQPPVSSPSSHVTPGKPVKERFWFFE